MSRPGWMTTYRDRYSDRPLNKLIFPASHSSGSYGPRAFGTIHGTTDRYQTQSQSIYDQLKYGIRELDIRPVLTPQVSPAWHCGHYSHTKDVGWQGASFAPLSSVVSEVNRYTGEADHDELIILRVSRVYKLMYKEDNAASAEPKNANAHPDPKDWASLFEELGRLNHLYGLSRAGGDEAKTKELHSFTLDRFLGDHQPAVVVLIDDYENEDSEQDFHEELFKHDFWPRYITSVSVSKQPANLERLDLNQMDSNDDDLLVVRTQPDVQPVHSTPDLDLDNKSILQLATNQQKRNLPSILQKALSYTENSPETPSKIEADNVGNADLLTVCLALTEHRRNLDSEIDEPVIVYGASIIDNAQVHALFYMHFEREKMDLAMPFPVNSGRESIQMDPWPDMVKSCAAIYNDRRYEWKPEGIWKGRWCREGETLHVEEDILQLTFGSNLWVLDAGNYYVLYRSLVLASQGTPSTSRGLDISPTSFGITDLASGKSKSSCCRFVVRPGVMKEVDVEDGGVMQLSLCV